MALMVKKNYINRLNLTITLKNWQKSLLLQRGRVLKRNTKKFLVWFSKRLIKPVRLLQCRCRWKRCLFQLHVIAIRLGVSRVSSDPGFYERYTNRTEPNELEKKRFKKKKEERSKPPLSPFRDAQPMLRELHDARSEVSSSCGSAGLLPTSPRISFSMGSSISIHLWLSRIVVRLAFSHTHFLGARTWNFLQQSYKKFNHCNCFPYTLNFILLSTYIELVGESRQPWAIFQSPFFLCQMKYEKSQNEYSSIAK